MTFDLKSLLVENSTIAEAVRSTIPNLRLHQGLVYERLYGMDGEKKPTGFWDGRTAFKAQHSRVVEVIDKSIESDIWHPCLTLNGSGFLSNLYGLDWGYDYKITIDGIEELTITNVGFYTKGILWGEHHTGRSNKHPGGYYFYSAFKENSPQYLINFLKGACMFEVQLKVEVKRTYAKKDSFLAFDYLMDGEIS